MYKIKISPLNADDRRDAQDEFSTINDDRKPSNWEDFRKIYEIGKAYGIR